MHAPVPSDVEDAGAPCFAVAPTLRLARRIGQPMRAVNDPAQRAPAYRPVSTMKLTVVVVEPPILSVCTRPAPST